MTTAVSVRSWKRIKNQIDAAAGFPQNVGKTMERLLAAAEASQTKGYLKWIKARHREGVRMIPVEDIRYFKADAKYTLVKTIDGESLIRTPISRLEADLDPERFWRIHRGTIINVGQIDRINRSFTGRLDISLKDLPEKLTVSKSYAHLFRQM